MTNWNRTFLKFTLIEWVIAILIVLSLARFIWAKELAAIEDSLFESIGLGGGAKYLVILPLVVWYLYWMFKREKAKAEQQGVKVVRPQVLVVSLGILALAIAIVVFLSFG